MPWEQIPVLEIDNDTLAQTVTICRYLGRKFNLVGHTEFHAAKCDEYVDHFNDFFECKYVCMISQLFNILNIDESSRDL